MTVAVDPARERRKARKCRKIVKMQKRLLKGADLLCDVSIYAEVNGSRSLVQSLTDVMLSQIHHHKIGNHSIREFSVPLMNSIPFPSWMQSVAVLHGTIKFHKYLYCTTPRSSPILSITKPNPPSSAIRIGVGNAWTFTIDPGCFLGTLLQQGSEVGRIKYIKNHSFIQSIVVVLGKELLLTEYSKLLIQESLRQMSALAQQQQQQQNKARSSTKIIAEPGSPSAMMQLADSDSKLLLARKRRQMEMKAASSNGDQQQQQQQQTKLQQQQQQSNSRGFVKGMLCDIFDSDIWRSLKALRNTAIARHHSQSQQQQQQQHEQKQQHAQQQQQQRQRQQHQRHHSLEGLDEDDEGPKKPPNQTRHRRSHSYSDTLYHHHQHNERFDSLPTSIGDCVSIPPCILAPNL